MNRIAILPLLILCPVLAQDIWRPVMDLKPGTAVRVKALKGAEYKGPLQAATGESVRLMLKGQEQTVAKSDITQVAVADPQRRGKRMLLGGLIGAGIGLVIGAVACPGCRNEGNDELPNALMAGGAAAGAGVGIALTAGMPYTTIYRAPRK